MISREEAKELSHDGSGFLTQETVILIDDIYDSIGTCGECAYCDIPHVREPASPCCTINYSSSHYWQEVELNGYCSRFKRKVD